MTRKKNIDGHKISVCMATCNGAKYLQRQMDSILEELKADDEVIVVDDCSSDDTVTIIKNFNDKRIKIYFNDRNRGHVFSFNRALSLAKNDFVIMSDQDDIWIKGRVSEMKKKLLDSGRLVVSSNSTFFKDEGNEIIAQKYLLKAIDSSNNLKNIINIFLGRAPYFGCTMAMRKEILKWILPIPDFVRSHDLWIVLASNLIGSNEHLEEVTLLRRVHDHNASFKKNPIFKKFYARYVFLLSIVVLCCRYAKMKKNKVLSHKKN